MHNPLQAIKWIMSNAQELTRLRKQRALLDRAIHALEQLERISSGRQREIQTKQRQSYGKVICLDRYLSTPGKTPAQVESPCVMNSDLPKLNTS